MSRMLHAPPGVFVMVLYQIWSFHGDFIQENLQVSVHMEMKSNVSETLSDFAIKVDVTSESEWLVTNSS
jgi:hypothetical protein